jgi:hypothetical protein
MENLALQIRKIDIVEVDDSNCPNPGRGEIERSWRSEPAGADAEDASSFEPPLPFRCNFGHHEMARITSHLLAA